MYPPTRCAPGAPSSPGAQNSPGAQVPLWHPADILKASLLESLPGSRVLLGKGAPNKQKKMCPTDPSKEGFKKEILHIVWALYYRVLEVTLNMPEYATSWPSGFGAA